MQRDEAEAVVAGLRARDVFAHVHETAGGNIGVRVVLPGGADAVWDADGAAALEAMVLRDGVLVGFVPQIPGSEGFDTAQVIDAIATARYEMG